LKLCLCIVIPKSLFGLRKFFGGTTRCGSASFQTCCIADFLIGEAWADARAAGLETRDTADLEVGATLVAASALRIGSGK